MISEIKWFKLNEKKVPKRNVLLLTNSGEIALGRITNLDKKFFMRFDDTGMVALREEDVLFWAELPNAKKILESS